MQEIAARSRQEMVAQVVEAYYDVLLAEGNLEVMGRALASARAQARRAADLFEKGLVVRSDLLRTQVLVGSLEREQLTAGNAVTVSRSRLRHVLGAEGDEFRLTESVEEDHLAIEELPSLVARARGLRPDLKATEKEVDRATESIRVAQADYYPSVGLVTHYEGNTRKFSSSGENFAVFVTANWNLFNGFATQEKVAEAEALLRRAQLLRDDLKDSLSIDVEENYLGLRTSRAQVIVARDNVAQADESLRIVKDRYSAGLARNVDVLDGEVALKSAEQDLLRAQVSSQIFRARLNLATGQLQ
jgi:outer membrane protein TolC